jgi:hypothetical protein
MGHFENGSRGDQSDPGRLDFHGNTPGRFRMLVVERHHNQYFPERIFRGEIEAIILGDDVRIDRLKNSIDTLHTHHPPHILAHAIHNSDLT